MMFCFDCGEQLAFHDDISSFAYACGYLCDSCDHFFCDDCFDEHQCSKSSENA